jgi:hypothetical protein
VDGETERLRAENAELRETVFRAWAVLVDWDGYWDPQTRKGDAAGLAGIVSEALEILNPPRGAEHEQRTD